MRNISRFPRLARVTTLALSVSALLSAGSALAVEHLYGGGSTFAAPPYVGADYLNVSPNARLSTNAGNTPGGTFTVADISAGSMFAVFSSKYAEQISYCQSGSGFGKNSLNGSASALASNSCEDYSGSPLGLSAPTNSPDFIGTDAPYSTSDYNNFLTGSQFATKQGLVQVPTVAGAIALPVNDAISNVNLNNGTICKIYSGVLKNWSGVPGVVGATGPIQIVYRTDSSGTTFAFTRYLASTCNGTTAVPLNFKFTPNSTFASALPNGNIAAVYGTRAIGASGNPGVVSTVLNASNPNAMGYADIGEVINEGAGYGLVNGFDPAKFGLSSTNVPTPMVIAVTSLLTGKVLDGATVNAVPGSSSQAIDNCMRLVNPSLTFKGYPIVAITYIAANYQGNGTNNHVNAIKALLGLPYNHTVRPALPAGFAYLDGSAPFASSVKATIAACVKN